MLPENDEEHAVAALFALFAVLGVGAIVAGNITNHLCAIIDTWKGLR